MRHRRCVVALVCTWLLAAAAAQISSQARALVVERRGDVLHLSAPAFHFLEGRSLEQLRDGAAVTYVFTVTVGPERGSARWGRYEKRFVFSYDLWEERYSVVEVGPPRRAASHLTLEAAENWCLANLLPRVPSAPPEKTFVVKLDCFVPEDEPQPGEGLTLSALLDVFSRKAAVAPRHWEAWSAALRVADLKNSGSKQ